MIHLVTGFTGAVVPVIVEELARREPEARWVFALRRGSDGASARARMAGAIASLELAPDERERLLQRSRAVEIDVAAPDLGLAPALRRELVAGVDRILHGAADVRFDQPYERIRIPNVVFVEKLYALLEEIRAARSAAGRPEPVLHYVGTAYAYGIHPDPVPEDWPEFAPGPPDNSYARTKAEAKRFLLDKMKRLDARVVIHEPTIVGGAAATGRTRAYHLHYLLLQLGYLGRLPFLAAPDNTLDIVPVDWVAGVVAEVVARDLLPRGVLRLASGERAVPIRYLYEAGLAWYTRNDPVPGHEIPPVRFVPAPLLPPLVAAGRRALAASARLTGSARHRSLARQLGLLQGYLPYMLRRKRFENARSSAWITRHTGYGEAPTLQDRFDAEGRLVERGYYERIMADTIRTGWGGRVDFARLRRSLERRTREGRR